MFMTAQKARNAMYGNTRGMVQRVIQRNKTSKNANKKSEKRASIKLKRLRFGLAMFTMLESRRSCDIRKWFKRGSSITKNAIPTPNAMHANKTHKRSLCSRQLVNSARRSEKPAVRVRLKCFMVILVIYMLKVVGNKQIKIFTTYCTF